MFLELSLHTTLTIVVARKCGSNSRQCGTTYFSPDAKFSSSFYYNYLVNKVKSNKEPATSIIVRHFQFNTSNQKAGESIAEYITILCKAAEHCNYGELLSEIIQDRLVCGITNTTV